MKNENISKQVQDAGMRRPQASIQAVLDLYQLHNRSEAKSESTLDWYERVVGRLIEWLRAEGELVPIGELSEDVLRLHVIYLSKFRSRGKELSRSTLNTYVRGMRDFLRWAYLEGFTEHQLLERFRPPRVPSVIVDTLEDDEIHRLVAAVSKSPRNHAIVMLLLDTGIRLSELVGLQLEDVNFEVGSVKVFGKGSKERIVPFGNKTHKVLREYILFHRPPVAGERGLFISRRARSIRKSGLQSLFRRLRTVTKIERLHVHLLRHTYATNFLRANGSSLLLKQNLGHSTMAMVDHYAHLASQRAVDVSRLFSPMDRLKAATSSSKSRGSRRPFNP